MLVRSRAATAIAAFALAGFLVGAAAGVNVRLLSNSPSSLNTANASDEQITFERVYTQVAPSVVKLVVIPNGVGPADPNAANVAGTQTADGSGFVWDTLGDIVTNNHVVEGAGQIQVTFADGAQVSGRVIGADPDSDLAVIKVDPVPDRLQPAKLADPTSVRVGQLAIVIGSPYGQLNTLTTGVVSALNRSLPVGGGNGAEPTYTIPNVVQTDAPINPGNSGGVLLDSEGSVVGVVSAFESTGRTSSGVGFAISSSTVEQVVPALIATGHYAHPYLGINGATLTPSVAKAMGLQASQRGALVTAVADQGPAAKAGVRGATQQVIVDGVRAPIGGDVIIAMDGQPVTTSDDLATYLARSTQANQSVTLTILRDGNLVLVHMTLEPRPSG
jgi:2-alkenal reductase